MRQVAATHILTLTDILTDWHLVNVSVGSQADLVLLLRKQTPDNKNRRRQFRRTRKDGPPNHFRIYHQVGEGRFETIDLPPVQDDFTHVQPLRSDAWLLVRPRSHGYGDHNASIYSANGSLLRSFHVGDAIQDVQVDEAGAIWVSFFDEGVFSAEDPAQAGLVCFNEEGQILFKYNELAAEDNKASQAPFIADCYAMNVRSQQEVWFYSYIDFPLVQLVERKIKRVLPDIPVKGSHAFAIEGRRVLFAGGYENWKKLFLFALDTTSEEQVEAIDEEGTRLSFRFSCGRGSHLYLVTERAIFMLDLDIL